MRSQMSAMKAPPIRSWAATLCKKGEQPLDPLEGFSSHESSVLVVIGPAGRRRRGRRHPSNRTKHPATRRQRR